MIHKDNDRERFASIIEEVRTRKQFSPIFRNVTLDLGVARTKETFDIAGEYIEVVSATDPDVSVDIIFNESVHGTTTLKNGDSIVTPFYRVFITNTVQTGKSLTLAFSLSFDLWRLIRSQQVLIGGEITAKDFLLVKTQVSEVFERGTSRTGAAGQFAGVQVFNPVGSGKTVIVTETIMSVGIAQAVILNLHNTVLTNLTGTLFNLDAGQPAASAELRTQSAAVPFGSINLKFFRVLASEPLVLPMWVILGPGEGLVWTNQVVATTIDAGFKVWEF